MINLRIGTVDIYLRIKQKVFQGQVTLCVSDALWSWRSLRSQKKTPGRRRKEGTLSALLWKTMGTNESEESPPGGKKKCSRRYICCQWYWHRPPYIYRLRVSYSSGLTVDIISNTFRLSLLLLEESAADFDDVNWNWILLLSAAAPEIEKEINWKRNSQHRQGQSKKLRTSFAPAVAMAALFSRTGIKRFSEFGRSGWIRKTRLSVSASVRSCALFDPSLMLQRVLLAFPGEKANAVSANEVLNKEASSTCRPPDDSSVRAFFRKNDGKKGKILLFEYGGAGRLRPYTSRKILFFLRILLP